MDFVKVINGEFWSGDPHGYFENVSTDTRKLRRDDCFFALIGENFDGHDFIKIAVGKNVSVVVFSRNDIKLDEGGVILNLPALIKVKDTLSAMLDFATYQRGIYNGKVVAFGGSNGKTTAKNMAHSILSLDGVAIKSFGNYNNEIGLSLTIFDLKGTEKYLILELGISKRGEMEKLSKIASPDIAVLTNIGLEHLKGLGSLEGVFEEEIKIFDNLRSDGIAVLNLDDPMLCAFSQKMASGKITFGTSSADIIASEIRNHREGISFQMKYGDVKFPISMKIVGEFNVYNALAAASVAYAFGLNADLVKQGLENFRPVSGRMEKIELPNGCVLVNDAYNANPSSMKEALKSFCDAFLGNKKVLVLGDMLELGNASIAEHEKLGEFIIALPFDFVFLYGGEMEHAYRKNKEVLESKNVKYFRDKEDLFEELKKDVYLSSDSAVFFKASHALGFEELFARISDEILKG